MLIHRGDNLACGTRHARSISLVPTIVVVVVTIICGLLLIVIILAAIIPGVIRVSTSYIRCCNIRSRSDWW
jgi:hypothetical protein